MIRGMFGISLLFLLAWGLFVAVDYIAPHPNNRECMEYCAELGYDTVGIHLEDLRNGDVCRCRVDYNITPVSELVEYKLIKWEMIT